MAVLLAVDLAAPDLDMRVHQVAAWEEPLELRTNRGVIRTSARRRDPAGASNGLEHSSAPHRRLCATRHDRSSPDKRTLRDGS